MATEFILQNATDEELNLAVEENVFASDMGYSPYLKPGLRDTGRRISRYLWRAA